MAKALVLNDIGYFHCTGGGSHPHRWGDGTITGPGQSDFVTIDGIPVALLNTQVQRGPGCYDIGKIVTASSFVTIGGVPMATSDSTISYTAGFSRLDTGYFPYTATYKHVEHIQ